MDESEKLICRAALAGPREAVRAWQDWRQAFDPAAAATLLTWAGGYIDRNLRRAGLDDPYLGGIAHHNWLTNNLKLARATPLLAGIAARWQIVPLKSFGLGEDTESRRLRPLADIDFYVDIAGAQPLIGELMRQGFVPLLNADWPEITNRIMTRRGSWNFTANGIDLDVHWKLFDHLDPAANRRLAKDWTVPMATAYGSVRILRPEATLCLLAAHQVTQESRAFSGLFDICEMAAKADPSDAARLAGETGTTEPLGALLRRAMELGLAEHQGINDLLRRLAGITRRGRPAAGAIQTGLARRPALYRLWTCVKRNAWLERLLLRLAGPFSSKRIELESSGRFVVDPSTEQNLGPGWHHLYPADRWRWAGAPDSRLAIQLPPESSVAISVQLVPGAWRDHACGTLGIFANGMLMARAGRDDHELSFDATGAVIRRFLEISLRLVAGNAAPHAGLHAPRNLLLAPVSRIRVDVTAA